MTDTLTRLAGPTAPSPLLAGTAIYTIGAGAAVVKNAIVTNTDPSLGAFLWLSVGVPTTVANRIANGVYVPPGKTLILPLDVVVTFAAGDAIYARQSSMVDPLQFTTPLDTAGLLTLTTDATTGTPASWTNKANAAYIMTVITTKASAVDTVTVGADSHTGMGTWTLLQTITDTAADTRITQFRNQSSGTSAAASPVVTSGGTATGWMIRITEFMGLDLTGTNGSAAFNALGTYESVGTSATPLHTYTDFGSQVFVGLATPLQVYTHIAMSGWTELSDVNYATPSTAGYTVYTQSPAAFYRPTISTTAPGTISGAVEFITPEKSLTVTLNGVVVT